MNYYKHSYKLEELFRNENSRNVRNFISHIKNMKCYEILCQKIGINLTWKIAKEKILQQMYLYDTKNNYHHYYWTTYHQKRANTIPTEYYCAVVISFSDEKSFCALTENYIIKIYNDFQKYKILI